MADITLRRRLSEPTFALNIALQGISDTLVTTSVSADIYWRWEDDPAMEPQFLGSAVAGHELAVPFDLQDRTIRLFSVARTKRKRQSNSLFGDAQQTTFAISAPALANLAFSSPNVTGDIYNNGGTGDISILRKLSTETEFSTIQTVSDATTSFTDTPPVNGDYQYKLTQVGQPGESNTLSVTVSGAGSGAGTPPDGLTAFFDGVDTVTLNWTNHGGTGDNIIEAKYGSGFWFTAGSVTSGTSTYNDTQEPGFTTRIVYYRVYNDAVIGYSEEQYVHIPPA